MSGMAGTTLGTTGATPSAVSPRAYTLAIPNAVRDLTIASRHAV